MAQQSAQSSGPEILIIRPVWPSSWWGEGLCAHLQGKGRLVKDLGTEKERPENRATETNIQDYLYHWKAGCVRKLVVFFGHGSRVSAVDMDKSHWINPYNYKELTKDLHVFMYGCNTASPCSRKEDKEDQCTEYGLGRSAVEGVCVAIARKTGVL
jgi:hypothetical protein